MALEKSGRIIETCFGSGKVNSGPWWQCAHAW